MCSLVLRRLCLHAGRLRHRPLLQKRNTSSSGASGDDRMGALMERLLGPGPSSFELAIRQSTIPEAGRGVFLHKGHVEVGQIVTLYPGTVYLLPYDLEAFTTGDDALDLRPPDILIANDYLLRFKHGGSVYMIDGCPRGISALAFTRVLEAKAMPANMSWLEEKGLLDAPPPTTSLQRQLALGNLLNDPEDEDRTNVRFEIFALPSQGLPPSLLPLLPSLAVSSKQRLVVAVTATKPLQASDPKTPVELFVCYGTDPRAMGYPI